MTREKDVLDARVAADQWAADHGYPPSGGYSADWFVNGYLGGWWPDGWKKWWAAYTNANGFPAPGSILVGLVVIHQYASNPVDMNYMLESEVVGPTDPGEMTVPEYKQAMAYLWHNVIEPLSSYKYPRIKAAVAEVERVVKQYGAI